MPKDELDDLNLYMRNLGITESTKPQKKQKNDITFDEYHKLISLNDYARGLAIQIRFKSWYCMNIAGQRVFLPQKFIKWRDRSLFFPKAHLIYLLPIEERKKLLQYESLTLKEKNSTMVNYQKLTEAEFKMLMELNPIERRAVLSYRFPQWFDRDFFIPQQFIQWEKRCDLRFKHYLPDPQKPFDFQLYNLSDLLSPSDKKLYLKEIKRSEKNKKIQAALKGLYPIFVFLKYLNRNRSFSEITRFMVNVRLKFIPILSQSRYHQPVVQTMCKIMRTPSFNEYLRFSLLLQYQYTRRRRHLISEMKNNSENEHKYEKPGSKKLTRY